MALDWSPVLRSEQVDVCTLLGAVTDITTRSSSNFRGRCERGAYWTSQTSRMFRRPVWKSLYEARMATKHAVVLNGSD